jgi:hypothetical protein
MTETLSTLPMALSDPVQAAPAQAEAVRALEIGSLKFDTLLVNLLILALPSLILLITFPGTGTTAMVFCAVVWSFPLSRLSGDPQAVRNALFNQRWATAGYLFMMLVGQSIAAATSDIFILGFLIRWIYLIATVGSVCVMTKEYVGHGFVQWESQTSGLVPTGTLPAANQRMQQIEAAQTSAATPPKKRANKQPVAVSLNELRKKRTEIDAGLEKLGTLKVFNSRSRALAEAWDGWSLQAIESLLEEGDARTRATRRSSVQICNSAIRNVDAARAKLGDLLKEGEAALSPYEIDYSALDIGRSKVLSGSMARAPVRDPGYLEKVQYTPRLARILVGSIQRMPWQVTAAAFAAVAAVWLIDRSKARRQLHDIQGQLALNAKATRGDIKVIRTLIVTRIIPHFDGILEVIVHLEPELADLKLDPLSQESGSRERAYRLARWLMQGRHYLEMAAGDT